MSEDTFKVFEHVFGIEITPDNFAESLKYLDERNRLYVDALESIHKMMFDILKECKDTKIDSYRIKYHKHLEDFNKNSMKFIAWGEKLAGIHQEPH